MSDQRLTVTINVRYVWVALAALTLHALLLASRVPLKPQLAHLTDYHPRSIQVTKLDDKAMSEMLNLDKVRKIGEQGGKGINQVLANHGVRGGLQTAKKPPQANPFKTAGALTQSIQTRQAAPARALSPDNRPVPTKSPNAYLPAPTTRPKALEMLKTEPVQSVAQRTQHAGAQALAGSPTLSRSLMNMQVEVPEGVAADELNEFELQFYGFQNRLVAKYLNSIELQVREYEKKFSAQTLRVEGKHVMTGRVTFDSDGNIKQIKMVRWTQADRLQTLFEDILKSMVSLPNPPKLLRNQQGEFVVFYTLTVNNG